MNKRNYLLDCGYTSCRSILNKVTDKELEDELALLREQLRDEKNKMRNHEVNVSNISMKTRAIEGVLENREREKLSKAKICKEHIFLLKEAYFEDLDFNKLIYDVDIAKTLGWKKPNEEMSDEQKERAEQLTKQLPFVLGKVIANIDENNYTNKCNN